MYYVCILFSDLKNWMSWVVPQDIKLLSKDDAL